MRIRVLLSIVLICLFTIPSLALATGKRHQFIVFFSNDVNGETEPCG